GPDRVRDDGRAGRAELLPAPLPPRRRGSRLFPRHDPLPHLLVPAGGASARGGALHDRHGHRGRRRRADLWGAWLTPEERRSLAARLGPEQVIEAHHAATLGAALADRRVWRLAVLYFVLVTGLYGVGLWLPQIVKGLSGLGDVMVGIVSAVPYVAAAAGMVLVGRHSDR